jgi:hypothetical protein
LANEKTCCLVKSALKIAMLAFKLANVKSSSLGCREEFDFTIISFLLFAISVFCPLYLQNLNFCDPALQTANNYCTKGLILIN